MTGKETTWFIIVNPHAGSGKTISAWKKAERQLAEAGIEYVCAETEHAGHAEELSYDAAAKGYRYIAAVGGDGTGHEVFCGICRWYEAQPEGTVSLLDFHVAVIPIGSGNDWIKSHGIPNNAEEAIRIMGEGKFHAQDAVRFSRIQAATPEEAATAVPDRVDYMLNIAGIGFDSRICQMVNQWKIEGQTGSTLYAKALAKVVKAFYTFPVDIWADGKRIYKGECMSMAFGTGKWSGGGMRQVPDAVVDDHLTDMMIAPKLSIKKLLPKLPLLFTDKFSTIRELYFIKASQIVVMPGNDKPEGVEIDGETVFGKVPVRVEVLREQINVLSNL